MNQMIERPNESRFTGQLDPFVEVSVLPSRWDLSDLPTGRHYSPDWQDVRPVISQHRSCSGEEVSQPIILLDHYFDERIYPAYWYWSAF
jgi:hypothetical protein